MRERIAKERGVQAVFSGQGGDHFFQSVSTRQIAAEYAWRHGLRGELLRVVVDTSRFTRKPIWSVAGAVVNNGLLRRRKDPYDRLRTPSLLSKAVSDSMEPSQFRHPWVDAHESIPNSKRHQAFNILDTQNLFRLPSHYAEIVHPLVSQPIIEVCLQIPSYVLTYGGIDRALVREAFDGMVPREIIQRTDKGATTGYFDRLLIRNLPFLQQYLLNGILMERGVLDKRATEDALSEASLVRGSKLLFPVLSAIRAEFWLRTWIDSGQRATA